MPRYEDVFNAETMTVLFPPSRTGDFFEALFGGAEDGAYDIRLAFRAGTEKRLDFFFELHQRNNKCLACNLTHGLPQVFARHPVINVKGLAAEIAALAGWAGPEHLEHASGEHAWTWELEPTEEVSDALHVVPFSVTRSL